MFLFIEKKALLLDVMRILTLLIKKSKMEPCKNKSFESWLRIPSR